MITLEQVVNRVTRVKTNDGVEFMLSVTKDPHSGVIACAAWLPDAKPIKRGKHKLINTISRDSWFLHLEIVTQS
jgi:hypothetical protein